MRTKNTLRFAAFGISLRDARKARRITQRDLAKRLGVGQQAVSSWERGSSRPEREVLVRKIAKIFPELPTEKWLESSGHEAPSDRQLHALPVRPLLEVLPLHDLTFQQFQGFSTMLLALIFEGKAIVNQIGVEGDRQDGRDIEVRFSGKRRVQVYQCKREKNFGPQKVLGAIRAFTTKCDLGVILLSRRATAAARNGVPSGRKWELWDVDDICKKIKMLPQIAQRQIIDAYFPSYRRDFLGIADLGGLETTEQFFAPLLSKSTLFSHAWRLAGRQNEIAQLVNLLARDPTHAAMLCGSGGIGKTRLALEVAYAYRRANQGSDVFFIAPGKSLTQTDVDMLNERRALAVIEDAHDHENIEVILGILSRCNVRPRLLLVTRPYTVSPLRSEAGRAGYVVNEESVVRVKALSLDDAESIAAEILDVPRTYSPNVAKQVARVTRGSSLALVLSSKLVATKQLDPRLLNNFEDFRDNLLERFRDALTGKIGQPADGELVRDVLDLAALVQPFDVDDPQFIELAQEIVQKPADKVKRSIQLLIDAGVMIRRGRMLRIVPDLLGEYILEQASLMDGGKRSTGYIERVMANAHKHLLANVLLNVSKLDWRINDGDPSGSVIANLAWSKVEELVSRATDADGTLSILEEVAYAAYYQPGRALAFYASVKDRIVDEDDTLRLLKHVAMNAEFLSDGCEHLWQLAIEQSKTKGSSDRAANILTELAHVEPHKPIEYCEMIVGFAIDKLTSAHDKKERELAFKVIEGALRTDGHTSESRGRSVRLTNFKVTFAAVSGLRTKIMEKLFPLLEDPDLQVSIRAIGAISGALHAPFSCAQTELPRWLQEFAEIVAKLEALIRRNRRLDPVVTIAIEKLATRLADYSGPPVSDAAGRVLDAIERTLRYRLTLALSDAWGEVHRRRHGEFSLSGWQADQRSIADELVTTLRPTEILQLLTERIEAVVHVDGGVAPGIVRMMAESNDEVGRLICECAIEKNPDSSIRFALGQALCGLASKSAEAALLLARRACALGNNRITVEVSWGYMCRFAGTSSVSETERSFVRELLAHQNPSVVVSAISAVSSQATLDPSWAASALVSVDLGKEPRLANELFREFMHHQDQLFAALSSHDIGVLLQKLEDVNDISDHWIGEFLQQVIEADPEAFVEFALKRVEADRKDVDRKYQPFPYMWDSTDRLSCRNSRRFPRCLQRIREWMSESPRDNAVAFWGPKLYHTVAGRVDELVIADLAEWLSQRDPRQFDVIASIVREGGQTFVFDHADFVVELLESSYGISTQCGKTMEGALWASAISGMKHGSPGQPFPEDIRRRDLARVRAGGLSRGSPAWRLFSDLSRDAEDGIRSKLAEDEELFEE